jgi:hypothetical protein
MSARPAPRSVDTSTWPPTALSLDHATTDQALLGQQSVEGGISAQTTGTIRDPMPDQRPARDR